MLAVYHPSVATVYSLLRVPSLAFLWTHGVAPSTYDVSLGGIVNPWTGARHTLGANLEALETGSPEFPRRPLLGSSVNSADKQRELFVCPSFLVCWAVGKAL